MEEEEESIPTDTEVCRACCCVVFALLGGMFYPESNPGDVSWLCVNLRRRVRWCAATLGGCLVWCLGCEAIGCDGYRFL